MSLASDYFADHAFEIEQSQHYADIQDIFSKKTDLEILDGAIQIGNKLDSYEYFKAYSIALKIKENNWKLSEKQRSAIINCIAHHYMEYL